MAGKFSRNKGANGERELAKEIARIFGVEAYRGRQYHGGSDAPDIVTDLDGLHFECKRTEKLSIYPALEQSAGDCGDKIPVVAHRKNHKEWIFFCYLNDLPKVISQLCDVIEAKQEALIDQQIKERLEKKRSNGD